MTIFNSYVELPVGNFNMAMYFRRDSRNMSVWVFLWHSFDVTRSMCEKHVKPLSYWLKHILKILKCPIGYPLVI